jgi:hypothetical protein
MGKAPCRLALFFFVLAAFSIVQLAGARRAAAPTASPLVDIGAGLLPVSAGSIAWGDYDRDGDLDLLLSGSIDVDPWGATKIYENDGGTFSEVTTADASLPPVYSSSVAWGDYDRDGDLDILVAGQRNEGGPTSRIYQNDGGSFADIGAGLTGLQSGSVAWGDYDQDGDADVLLTGADESASTGHTEIYRNNGNGTFTPDPVAEAPLADVYSSSAAWGDYDSDGDPDIALMGNTGTGRLSAIYANDGDGSFEESPVTVALAQLENGALAWGDYDADSDLDLAIQGYGSSGPVSKIYRNDGMSFNEATEADVHLAQVFGGSVAWGDYDSDGDLDLALAGDTGSGKIGTVYYQDADGVFQEDTAAAATIADVSVSSLAWGDYDSDGRLDLALTGYRDLDRVSSIYHNELVASGTRPSAPGALWATRSGDKATLGWNAATDAQQTGGADLSYNLRVGTTPGGSQVVSPMALANGTRLVAAPGDVGERTSHSLLGLAHGRYYWSVQAVDNGFAGSTFASEQSFVINAAPSAGAGGPYAISEGEQLQLNGSASDPDHDELSYLWTLNGQGSFTTQSPAIPWSALESLSLGDGPASLTASLTVTDSFGASEGSTATVTIDNAPPVASVSGPSSTTTGKSTGWTLSATDPSSADQAASFKYEIDWNGDGSIDQTVSGGHSTSVSHKFSKAGSATVGVTASDKNGGKSASVSKTVTVKSKEKGKIKSAKLAKTSFSASQAKKIKLTVTFKPKSKLFKWQVSLKHGKKWQLVKSKAKHGSFSKLTMTVKKLFAGKKMKKGVYRLKLSADRNSKTLKFRIR